MEYTIILDVRSCFFFFFIKLQNMKMIKKRTTEKQLVNHIVVTKQKVR